MANKFRNSISIRKELYNAVREFCKTTKEDSLSGYITRLILEDLARHNIVVDIELPKPRVKKAVTAPIAKPAKVVSKPSELKKAPKIEKIEQILENLPTEKPITVDVPITETAVKPKTPDVVIPIVSEPLETPVPDPIAVKAEPKPKPPVAEEPIKASPKVTVVDHPMSRYKTLLGGEFRKPKSLPPAKVFGYPPIDSTNPASYRQPNGATVEVKPQPQPPGEIFFVKPDPLKVDTPQVKITQDSDPKYDLRHLNLDVVHEGEVVWVDPGTVTLHPQVPPKPPEVIQTVDRNSTFTAGVEQTTVSRVDSNQTFVKPRSWQNDLASNRVGEFSKQPSKRTIVKPNDLQVIVSQSSKEIVGAEYTAEQPNSNLDVFAPDALEKASQEFVEKPVHTPVQHIEPSKKKKKKKVEPKVEPKSETTTPKHLTPTKLLAPPKEILNFRDSKSGGMSFSSGFDDFDEVDDERYKQGTSFSSLPPEKVENVGDITVDANGNSFFDGPVHPPEIPPRVNVMDSVPGPSHVPMPSRDEVPMSLWQCQIGTHVTFIAAQNVEQVQKYVANSLKLPSREAIQPSPYIGHYNKEFLVPGVLVPDEVRAVFGGKELPLS